MSDIIKEYSNDDITVVWQPAKCSHSTVCAKSLSDVFNPNARPWINMQGGDTESIAATVNQCPSGALSIKDENMDNEADKDSRITMKAFKNGPILISCDASITMPDGTVQQVSNPALCRCGASANKPFCDGSHVKQGFEG